MGEKVRLDSCPGEYDGYGRAGDFAYEDQGYLDGSNWVDGEPVKEPVAWHEVCFQEASPQAKADMTGSENAPNQGFGEPDPRFM